MNANVNARSFAEGLIWESSGWACLLTCGWRPNVSPIVKGTQDGHDRE